MVTIDGDVIDIDDQHDPELLWGLRGGGGNFGIITHLRYALTPVPRMYGGALRFRGDGIRDVIMRVFEIEAAAPDELVQAIVAWRAEDGSPGISVNFAWRGDPEAGAAAVRALADHHALFLLCPPRTASGETLSPSRILSSTGSPASTRCRSTRAPA